MDAGNLNIPDIGGTEPPLHSNVNPTSSADTGPEMPEADFENSDVDPTSSAEDGEGEKFEPQ